MNKDWLYGLVVLAALTGCSPSEPETNINKSIEPIVASTPAVSKPLLNFADSASQFAASAQNQSQAMLTACAAMQIEIQNFLSNPSEHSQTAARDSYRPCYLAWIGASVYFQQPFNLSDKNDFNKLVDLIDTRPFLPGYIDGIQDYPFSGLVHELDLKINADTLRSQHRLMDEDSASLGFPVIEFFLWKVPTEAYWLTSSRVESRDIIERRQAYLEVATTLLLEQLSQAVLRWRAGGEFSQLPEAAQQQFVLRSLQRLTLLKLLNNLFEQSAITEPEWHHLALISGQGRQYISAQLATLQKLFAADTALHTWLAQDSTLPFNAEQLLETLTTAQTAIAALPENYPAESDADDNWRAAQKQVAELALKMSQLSEHFGVTLVTE